MKAKSIKGKSAGEIRSALAQSTADGFKPTLAIVFLSVSQDRKAIIKVLDKAGIKIFGATTNGEFIDENPEKHSVAILLMEMNPDHFSILTAGYPEKNYREVARAVAVKAKQLFQHPAPDWDVMEKVIKGAEDLKATAMPEADALVIFSCAGRIISLGPLMSEEIEGVKKVWGAPIVGMFSNAELARATGGNLEMHNLTTCVVALKEK